MTELMREWIGRLFEIRGRRWRKPQQVRIVDVELDEDGRTWFWAKYA